MSLETWKAEFYPVEASLCPEGDAIAHSLQKWRGLTKDNLERHGVAPGDFSVHAETCALCVHHLSDEINTDPDDEPGYCATCPLAITLGRACDKSRRDDDGTPIRSPFEQYTLNGNPLPMIRALERTLDRASGGC